MAKKVFNTDEFIEAWKEEKSLWDVTSDIYKNRFEKANSLKKLAEKLAVSSQKNCSCFLIKLHCKKEPI